MFKKEKKPYGNVLKAIYNHYIIKKVDAILLPKNIEIIFLVILGDIITQF